MMDFMCDLYGMEEFIIYIAYIALVYLCSHITTFYILS
jgi:hypothetical protein